MKTITYIFLTSISFISNCYSADNIIENIAEMIIEKNLPYLLHEQTDKKWEMGTYSIKINRLGRPILTSNTSYFNLSLPINADIKGKIKKDILGTKITISCNSTFTTKAVIKVTPKVTSDKYETNVNISIDIPPTYLVCDGLRLQIKPVLESLIKDEKHKWELDLESNINKVFKQAGI
ncbi:DUF4403 family protein [Colwellia psychrerythraea]|uniref:Uncharacterized protein n=1 Tax=Colwellia psychrerythraea TaxID=28229 RepID=A0A099L158_COLPS|nr:DUF4403 family protein [Colwellia psychrerythraea]KGJ95877.1 Protein of unknown function DUF4403 [Colwellia psychrerythraea]